jgi:hypothetical protein
MLGYARLAAARSGNIDDTGGVVPHETRSCRITG